MSREKKIEIALFIAGWLLSGAVQAGTFIYSYGRLSQKVDDVVVQVNKLEQLEQAKLGEVEKLR